MAGLDFLRGLFGSSARQQIQPGESFVARADPRLDDPISREIGISVMKRAPVLAPPQRADPSDGPSKWQIIGASLQDAGAALRGGQGTSLARVQDSFRKRAEDARKQAEMENIKALAGQLYGDDPEAQLLFAADPEAFVGARVERLKPRTMSGGQTYVDPMTGGRYTAPSVEKFDDRMGYYDPNTGDVHYSAPRGPTFQESTGRMTAEEARRHNLEQEVIGRMNAGTSAFSAQTGRMAHTAREAAGGYGTPGGGGGGSDFSKMSTQELIDALRNAR